MTTVTKKENSTLSTPLPLAVALSDNETEEMLNKQKNIVQPYSEDGLRVSEDVYWADYYEHPDFSYEWNNGILEEKGMSNIETSLMYAWFWKLLDEFLTYHPIAQAVGLEIGGYVPITDETVIRRPDLWVILNNNPTALNVKDNTYHGTFDMCIEAISKTKEKYKIKDTVTKKQEYALGGIKEYYILDGDGKETVFYCLDEQGKYEEIESEDGVIKSKVLPGFQFRVSDLYERPSIKELRHDEVYKGFVALDLQDREAEIERLKALLKREAKG